MRSDELSPSEVIQLYDSYSDDEKGKWGERCAFRATWEIVRTLLRVEPRFCRRENGDLHAIFHRDGPNEWIVPWNEPARNRITPYRDRTDISVWCNNTLIVAIEVKNWNPYDYWDVRQVIGQLLIRFVLVPRSATCVLLTTNSRFPRWTEPVIGRLFRIRIRLVRSFPMPRTGLGLAIAEMRRLLEELVTLDTLTEKAWDFDLPPPSFSMS